MDSSTRNSLDQEAVQWFMQVEREEAGVDTLSGWQQWMERSSAHRSAYETVQRTWRALDAVSSPPWPTDAEVMHDRDGIADLRRKRIRHWTGWAAAAALAALAAGIWLFMPVTPGNGAAFSSTVATRIAEHRQIALPDGSSMQVGAHTELLVRYTGQQRRIQLLSGEAFFTVERDPSRPFMVEAGPNRVTAIGTSFNVRRYGEAVAVEVAEGRVRLENSELESAPTALLSGQEAVLTAEDPQPVIRHVAAGQVATWRDGQHRYIDAPLQIVVADLNRYATRPVLIDDSAAANLRITATFLNQDWEGWLNTLEAAVPALRVHDDKDAVHISTR